MSTESAAKELREKLRILERKMGLLGKSEASCCGITFGQCHALVEIGRAREMSLIQLAQMLGLDASTLSRTINTLVDSGLVQRQTDPGDRRYLRIKLTDEGLQVFDSIEKTMARYFAAILDSIPESRHRQVIESLQLLIDALAENRCC